MNKRISKQGLNLIKEFEGLRLNAYVCPAGILTIGFGHAVLQSDNIKLGDKITLEQAEKFLMNDVAWAETAVNRFVKVAINQNQFDALVSFVYNIGVAAFLRSSVLRWLNANNFGKAIYSLQKYTFGGGKKLKGLVRRRTAEAKHFNS